MVALLKTVENLPCLTPAGLSYRDKHRKTPGNKAAFLRAARGTMSKAEAGRLRKLIEQLRTPVLATLVCAILLCAPRYSLAGDTVEAAIVRENGVLKVPVQLNGVISLKFIVDSGAADIQIPKDVFNTLIRAETIKESDFLPGKTFVLADGSNVKSDRFILRSIKVGESTFSDVEASVGGLDAPLLLGQSFLSRFKGVTIDNQKSKLILTQNIQAGGQVRPNNPARGQRSAAQLLRESSRLDGGTRGGTRSSAELLRQSYADGDTGEAVSDAAWRNKFNPRNPAEVAQKESANAQADHALQARHEALAKDRAELERRKKIEAEIRQRDFFAPH